MAPVFRKLKIPECSTSSTTTSKRESPTKPSKHTRTNINRLPFDCFYLIFDRFPIQKLLPLRAVCHSWNNNIRQVCTRLTLIPYDSDTGPHSDTTHDIYWTNDLKGYIADRDIANRHDCIKFPMASLTIHTFDCLEQLFPRLSQLRIRYDCDYESCDLAALVNAKLVGHMIRTLASDQLKSFQFWLPTNPHFDDDKYRFMLPLYKVFGELLTRARFPSLTQLDLCVAPDKFVWPENYQFRINFANETEPNINILFQLERFSMNYRTNGNAGEIILSQLGPQLTALSIECSSFGCDFNPPDTLLDSVRFDGLTHLSLDNLNDNVRILQLFCDRFRSTLQFVQLKPCQLIHASFDPEWFVPLAKLDRLAELRIHNFGLRQFKGSSLPSIRKLVWCKEDLLHDYYNDDEYWQSYRQHQYDGDTFCRTLAAQFPNLEELIILCDLKLDFEELEEQKQTQLKQQIREDLDRYFVHLRCVVLEIEAPEFDCTNRNLEYLV